MVAILPALLTRLATDRNGKAIPQGIEAKIEKKHTHKE
jgi:hypothetical protein